MSEAKILDDKQKAAEVTEEAKVAEVEATEEVEEESFKQMFEASLKEHPEVRRGEMVNGMIS